MKNIKLIKILIFSLLLMLLLSSCEFDFNKTVDYQITDQKSGFNYILDSRKEGYVIEGLDEKSTFMEEALIIPETLGENGLPVIGIGYKALFNLKYLKELHLPSTIKSIDSLAFYLCSNLKSIHFDGTTDEWKKIKISSSFDDTTAEYIVHCHDGDVVLKSGTVYEDYYLFTYEYVSSSDSYIVTGMTEQRENIKIPASYNDKKVTGIKKGAFKGDKYIKSVTISSNINSIGKEAFYNCKSLESVKVLGELNSIGEASFKECPNLKNVEINGGVGSIGKSAFESSYNMESVNIKGKVNEILDSAFAKCSSLQYLYIDRNSVTRIDRYAFFHCILLGKGNFPEFLYNISSVGAAAFFGCERLVFTPNNPSHNSKKYVIFENLTEIGQEAFVGISKNNVAFALPKLKVLSTKSLFNNGTELYISPYTLYYAMVDNKKYVEQYKLGLALDMEHVDSSGIVHSHSSKSPSETLSFPFFYYEISSWLHGENKYEEFFEDAWDDCEKKKKYNASTMRDKITFVANFSTLGKDLELTWKCPYYNDGELKLGEIKLSWDCPCGGKENNITYKEEEEEDKRFTFSSYYRHNCR